ncbi:hypothetical protein SEA_NEDARYA_90 [Gordonia phage Nedarya]|nr:hypothetical protein SEA_NEDARYA_90 [Gordonia phage Nedarya]
MIFVCMTLLAVAILYVTLSRSPEMPKVSVRKPVNLVKRPSLVNLRKQLIDYKKAA